MDLGAIEQTLALVGRQAVRHVLVLHDLGERATTVVLADHVLRDAILGRGSLEEPGEEVLEHRGDCILVSVRRRSSSGRFAERVLSGVDDAGLQERIVFWVERRDGGVWLVGRAVNPQLRQTDDTRPEDILFEGYELDDALTCANEALEDDARVIEDDRGDVDVKPFTRKEVLPLLERFFFGR